MTLSAFLVRSKLLIISTLFFLSTFDATTLFKFGLTINFYEILVFILFLKSINLKYLSYPISKIELNILVYSILALIVMLAVQLRIFFGDLIYNGDSNDLIIRTFKTHSKLIYFFVACFFISRKFKFTDNQYILGVVYGGLPASIFAIIQSVDLPIGMYMIHNNPSYGEDFRFEYYLGGRPVGLSNEASFYVYQLSFSLGMLLLGYYKEIINRKNFFIICAIYTISILMSNSRTVFYLIPLIILVIGNKLNAKISMRNLFSILFLFIVCYFVSLNLSVQYFNIIERIQTILNFEDMDDSMFIRYHSILYLYRLFLDKCTIMGIGLYNYIYFISDYFDLYFQNKIGHSQVPSFSLLLQFLAELGSLPFFILFIRLYYYQRKCTIIEYIWFIVALCYSLTFQVTNLSVTYFILLYLSKCPGSNSQYTNKIKKCRI